MRKLLIALLLFPTLLVAQRGRMATISAEQLGHFCGTYVTAFAPGTGESYKDRRELIESTRCFNYVSAVMDESAGAFWETKESTAAQPVVRQWHWVASANEVIHAFVVWLDKNMEHNRDPANIAIKECGVVNHLYQEGDN